MRAHLLFLDSEAIASARRIVLDDVRAEVEELLQRQQVLVGLLAPLSKADQHEVLLEVTLLLGEGVQPGVLDRDRGLHRQGLRASHFFRRELAVAAALHQHRGSDRLLVGDQWQRHQ